jgi:putative transposase
MKLTMRALERAISARGTAHGLMFHSDRGVEYGAHRYQALLQAHSIVPSMNRPYPSQDNAHVESFFHSLKAELLHRREIAVPAGYIDRFYNVRSGGYIRASGTIPRSSSTSS